MILDEILAKHAQPLLDFGYVISALICKSRQNIMRNKQLAGVRSTDSTVQKFNNHEQKITK